MKKKVFLVSSTFLLLCGCGSSQSVLPSNVSTDTTSATNSDSTTSAAQPSTSSSAPSVATGKSSDPQLENFAAQINSDKFAGDIIVQVDNSDGVSVAGNHLVKTGKAVSSVTSLLNDSIDAIGSGAKLMPLFGKDPQMLKNMVKQLEVVSGKKLQDLSTFYKISVTDPKKAETFVRQMWKGSGVQYIYPRLNSKSPGMQSIPDLSGRQGYLNSFASAGGLGFDAAWARGLKGDGVRITDVECDWNPSHEDLPRQSTIARWGGAGCHPTDIAHGTAVLGVLVGVDTDAHGIKGTATHATVETIGGRCQTYWKYQDVVSDSFNNGLNFGDITLCEEQFEGPSTVSPSSTQGQPGAVLPEVYPDVFAGVQVASAAGIITIEPSGNGSVNLDNSSTYFSTGPDLRVQDSGSIVVGASMGGTDRSRAVWSNCGSRVNLHAWGSGVVTISYPGVGWDWLGSTPPFNNDPNQPNTYYTNAFGGTSSAAAMVAGAAAIVQGYAKQQMGGYKYLTAEKLREILAQSGVAPSSDGGCKIGMQPRVDVALQLFDSFWNNIKQNYPELVSGSEVKNTRRKMLRDEGIGLVCKLYNFNNSDPSCPETARCVLQANTKIPLNCNSTLCMPIDVPKSDYDCMAGAIWPGGLKMAKQLDFDGDGKADLVSWTANGWKISLSSKSSFGDGFGAWDIQMNPPKVQGRWVWPVVEDYNRDGRADLAVYDKEHGVWYIKFTDKNILAGRWTDWDWKITLPYHDELNRDVRLAKYARPLPGDYNGDGYIDLALARSDGIWSIDFGGPNRSDYGAFDQNVNYLTAAQLAAAPGWAYLPIQRSPSSTVDYDGGIVFKTPDGVTGAGQMWYVHSDGIGRELGVNSNNNAISFGGNELVPLLAWGESKSLHGNWFMFDDLQQQIVPMNLGSVFGGLDCHPFIADFDGDGKRDRAVQCPNEFRIVLSSTGAVQHVPLGYTASEFSLPGKIFVGGISYQTSQQIVDYQLSVSNDPPVVPVDMVQGDFCSIPWQPSKIPQECR